ncbi:helix-turn-helix domain-containing protein [Desulfobaculum bizertense]|uniref:Helix-turn-helix domain-containing protein n=1 Tax=Desulfobaculum bizertense DSM 18034 TaxID=1121442 RepID=A0A1T4W9Z5_9BACT|nr:helix-turn-helix transcriptional regulator [Desulfobaculum bizertense]UIJ39189.1 helix-turn-helix transcriptional regulator [Desulfobaculum bizertense]SKA73531.1 Helix-turn-helix domain-containing protein [Desulfobaculum bizertense DSM 18034]
MAKNSLLSRALSPEADTALQQLGKNIRRARIRRGIKQAELAERAGMAVPTLRRLESGKANVGLAVLVQVLEILGLIDQIGNIAHPDTDTLGKALEEQQLRQRVDSKRVDDDLDF